MSTAASTAWLNIEELRRADPTSGTVNRLCDEVVSLRQQLSLAADKPEFLVANGVEVEHGAEGMTCCSPTIWSAPVPEEVDSVTLLEWDAFCERLYAEKQMDVDLLVLSPDEASELTSDVLRSLGPYGSTLIEPCRLLSALENHQTGNFAKVDCRPVPSYAIAGRDEPGKARRKERVPIRA